MSNEEILARAWDAGATNMSLSTNDLSERLAEEAEVAWEAGATNMPYNPKRAAEALEQ